jgi:hypothetical protein
MKKRCLLFAVFVAAVLAANVASACGGQGDCKVLTSKCTDPKWQGVYSCVKNPVGVLMASGFCDEYGGQSSGHCGTVYQGGNPLAIACGPGFMYNFCWGPPKYTCYCPNGFDPNTKACKQ